MLMFISPEAAKITSNDLEQCIDTPDHRSRVLQLAIF